MEGIQGAHHMLPGLRSLRLGHGGVGLARTRCRSGSSGGLGTGRPHQNWLIDFGIC
jgi:hypothetical protein